MNICAFEQTLQRCFDVKVFLMSFSTRKYFRVIPRVSNTTLLYGKLNTRKILSWDLSGKTFSSVTLLVGSYLWERLALDAVSENVRASEHIADGCRWYLETKRKILNFLECFLRLTSHRISTVERFVADMTQNKLLAAEPHTQYIQALQKAFGTFEFFGLKHFDLDHLSIQCRLLVWG